MHKGLFWSPKNVHFKKPNQRKKLDNPIYQQKATQLALLQMTNPSIERNNEKSTRRVH